MKDSMSEKVINTLEDVFIDEGLKLPYIEARTSNTFLHLFENKCREYLKRLNEVSEENLYNTDKSFFLYKVEAIINGIKGVLTEYLKGYPSKSYTLFEKMVKECGLQTIIFDYKVTTISKGHNLYRIKKNYKSLKEFTLLSKEIEARDLFHVPFQSRKIIGTNRFSIPGFPCLYTSDSVKTSWSECLNTIDETFWAVSFKNQRESYLIDLVPFDFKNFNRNSLPYMSIDTKDISKDKYLIDYAYMYPLILACHSKIQYIPEFAGQIQFKSEYIIPQLLLQWYNSNKLSKPIDGIRYHSCTAEIRYPNDYNFSKYNYVLPAKHVKEKGHCESLSNNFFGSDVIPHFGVGVETEDELFTKITAQLKLSKYKPLY